jgi:hypothetical protein
MCTFGGQSVDLSAVAGVGRRTSPRRALAVSALGVLTVVGATAAYLGVVNGLMPALADRPAAAGTVAPPDLNADAGIGSGPTQIRKPRVRPISPDPDRTGVPAPRESVVPPAARRAGPFRTVKPTSPGCPCTPPVPTPTAPTVAPSPTPSASDPSSSAEPSPSESSADPDESPEPDASPEGRHRRHRY